MSWFLPNKQLAGTAFQGSQDDSLFDLFPNLMAVRRRPGRPVRTKIPVRIFNSAHSPLPLSPTPSLKRQTSEPTHPADCAPTAPAYSSRASRGGWRAAETACRRQPEGRPEPEALRSAIDLRSRHVLMSEKFLHGSYILPALQQVRRETVPKDVKSHMLRNYRLLRGHTHRPLRPVLMDVMPPIQSSAWIAGDDRRREPSAEGGAHRSAAKIVSHTHPNFKRQTD